MAIIKKVKLLNFKRFRDCEIDFNEGKNILVGDNEAGKSTILLGLDLVIRGSRSKVETIGLERLLNRTAVDQFMSSTRDLGSLPSMAVEIYLDEQDNPDLNGNNNSKNVICDGLQLSCQPIEELLGEVGEILQQGNTIFPFEYYSISFSTFSGLSYTGNRRFIKHLLIDNSQIDNDYATREYTKSVYSSNVEATERNLHQIEYRKCKSYFQQNVLAALNSRLDKYDFDVRTDTKSNLQTDLTITEDGISIENKGKGRQCFIKTEFALQRSNSDINLDLLLLEEPENHLSHTNMKRLIDRIADDGNSQIFIATHNSLICTRLDLRKIVMLNSSSESSGTLRELPEETAKFFVKAPDNNVLEFILSSKVILVEGDAEYMLIPALFKNATNQDLEDLGIHVISVGGTSFKRYLDIAKILGIKTAVIRDNDENHEINCISRYRGYSEENNISIFSDLDNSRYTFEICVYQDNQDICEQIFSQRRRTLLVQEYMLKNKADAAFKLLDTSAATCKCPRG